MIASAVRLRQLSPVSSVQSDAVARPGSARFPRKVKLQAWSNPSTRSVNPSASEVCAREISEAEPASFQLERSERHWCDIFARIFPPNASASNSRSEEHTSELQSHSDLVCRLLLEKKK